MVILAVCTFEIELRTMSQERMLSMCMVCVQMKSEFDLQEVFYSILRLFGGVVFWWDFLVELQHFSFERIFVKCKYISA